MVCIFLGAECFLDFWGVEGHATYCTEDVICFRFGKKESQSLYRTLESYSVKSMADLFVFSSLLPPGYRVF